MGGSRGEAGRGRGGDVGFENNIKYPSSLETLGGLAGELGLDYPTYATIPDTSFTCSGKDTGYYADTEAGCQVRNLVGWVIIDGNLEE